MEHIDDDAAKAARMFPSMAEEAPESSESGGEAGASMFPSMSPGTPSEEENIEGRETGGSEGDDEAEINQLIEAGDYEGLYQSIRSDVEASGTEEDLQMVDYFARQADVADPSWQKFIANAALQVRRNARRR